MSDYLDGLKKLRGRTNFWMCAQELTDQTLDLLIAKEECECQKITGTCTLPDGTEVPITTSFEPPQAKPDRAYLIAEKYFEGSEIDRCATAIRQREGELKIELKIEWEYVIDHLKDTRRTEMHRRLREVAERVWKTSDLGGNAYLKILAELDAEAKEGK